jgi:hypothetical protein
MIKEKQMNMTRDDIINDLMKRRPKGPGREKIAYTIKASWCKRTHRNKNKAVPSSKKYGYADEELFDLDFKSNSDVKDYLRQRDFDNMSDEDLRGKKRTLSRRANIVWKRLSESVHRVTQDGSKGIYEVIRGYYGRQLGHLFSRNKAEALENAKLFFGYLCDAGHDDVRVKFVKLGSVADIHALNVIAEKKVRDSIRNAKITISHYQKDIADFEAVLITMKMVENQQVAVETVEALNHGANNVDS